MNTVSSENRDEARDILDALRQIQDNPELQTEAETSPESLLNRLKLSGVARHAVAFAITGFAVGTHYAPAAGQHLVSAQWWGH